MMKTAIEPRIGVTADSHRRKSAGSQGQRTRHHRRPGAGSDFNGIHRRRDKRHFFTGVKPLSLDEATEGEAVSASQQAVLDPIPKWSEALMLWLSWNSTYEKLAQQMFKAGQRSDRLEMLMDELDQLRSRAVQLSEALID